MSGSRLRRFAWRRGLGWAAALVALTSVLLAGAGTPVRPPLTAERAADLAVADLRAHLRLPPCWRLFLGEVEQWPGVLRLQLLVRASGEVVPGRVAAVYEFDPGARRVVRRDFSPLLGPPLLARADATPTLPAAGSRAVPAVGVAARSGPTPTAAPDRATETAGATPTVSIHGTLRNLPGYLLDTPDFASRFKIWAEVGGYVVATETEIVGTSIYVLRNVPVGLGPVAVKAKIRGYDLLTLHPAVQIDPAHPAGVIAGVDVDFHQLTPLQREVRLVVTSAGGGESDTFPTGARARVYACETGQSVDVVSQNGRAEAVFSGIPAGWPLRFFASRLDAGYITGQLGPLTVPEDGGTMYTDVIVLR